MQWNAFKWNAQFAVWNSTSTVITTKKGTMIRRLIVTFEKLSGGNFLARFTNIITSLGSAPGTTYFPEPWPGYCMTRAEMATYKTTYEPIYNAAADGDRGAIMKRDAMRAEISAKLKLNAGYFEGIASDAGDPSMLEATGYELRNPIIRSGVNGLPDAPVLTLKRGKVSGVILASVKREKNVGAFEVQVAIGDPNVPANWKTAVTSKNARSIAINDLTPGTLYYFRVRAIGSKGPGAWSDIASIMAV